MGDQITFECTVWSVAKHDKHCPLRAVAWRILFRN
jgi:hypothetical protein